MPTQKEVLKSPTTDSPFEVPKSPGHMMLKSLSKVVFTVSWSQATALTSQTIERSDLRFNRSITKFVYLWKKETLQIWEDVNYL